MRHIGVFHSISEELRQLKIRKEKTVCIYRILFHFIHYNFIFEWWILLFMPFSTKNISANPRKVWVPRQVALLSHGNYMHKMASMMEVTAWNLETEIVYGITSEVKLRTPTGMKLIIECRRTRWCKN